MKIIVSSYKFSLSRISQRDNRKLPDAFGLTGEIVSCSILPMPISQRIPIARNRRKLDEARASGLRFLCAALIEMRQRVDGG